VKTGVDERTQIEALFEKGRTEAQEQEQDQDQDQDLGEQKDDEVVDLDDEEIEKKHVHSLTSTGKTIVDFLLDKHIEREDKLQGLTTSLNENFPPLEGDKVTFIGSTFLRYGDEDPEPYLNHIIALNTCSPVAGVEVESYTTEKEVLCAWQELIQREDPDIIIGYNIFGFDYQFMFLRAKELGCERPFLQLSRNKNEVCLKRDWRTGKEGLEENTIVIASGQHDLKFVKMTGRLQIDLYNYFRRDYQLTQYKLDYVSGYFIGDDVKKLEYLDQDHDVFTKVYSKNLTGLENGSFINFE
jgi:DNA polymerase elongation subunit (family B)